MSDKRCPNCGVILTRWFVEPDVEHHGIQTWRVVQWREGVKTGRQTERMPTIMEAESVMRALNMFAPDVM